MMTVGNIYDVNGSHFQMRKCNKIRLYAHIDAIESNTRASHSTYVSLY